MNIVRSATSLLVALILASCTSAQTSALSVADIADIFDIRVWRVPQPPKGHEWSLEIVKTLPSPEGAFLGTGTAVVSLRPTSNEEYEFVLRQLGARGSGTISPCREPEGTPPVCDGYSLKLETRPHCLGECSRAVLGEVTAMLNPADKRWLLLVAERSLTIKPHQGTVVTPIP